MGDPQELVNVDVNLILDVDLEPLFYFP